MSVRALLAAIVVVSVPIAVNGAEPQTTQQPVAKEKRVCTTRAQIGTRLARIRECRTAAEREALKQEQYQVVDRVQARKVTFARQERGGFIRSSQHAWCVVGDRRACGQAGGVVSVGSSG